jgi:hypothetical protein
LKGELIMGVAFYVQRTVNNQLQQKTIMTADECALDNGGVLLIRKAEGGFPTMDEIIKGLEANPNKQISVRAATGGSRQNLNVVFKLQEQKDGMIMDNLKWAGKAAVKTGVSFGAGLVGGPLVGAGVKVGLDAAQNSIEAYSSLWYTPVDFKITTANVQDPQIVLPKTAYKLNQVATEIRTKYGWGRGTSKDVATNTTVGFVIGQVVEGGANYFDASGMVAPYVGKAAETGVGFAGDWLSDTVGNYVGYLVPERLKTWWNS